MDMPPPPVNLVTPPAMVAHAPVCHYLTQFDADQALVRIQARLASTRFAKARPSEICGMVMLQTEGGKVMYTDPTGRYLILAFALDTHKGGPADNDQVVEEALGARGQSDEPLTPSAVNEPMISYPGSHQP